ncbi:MAG TPA: hypothetical protein PKN95_02445 [Verrucomicrobiota bacterium]|nr:hypothetical protein [Verrucomicrobiota bacterium]HNT13896.1 hypothetical protein [Verrucomicrobiota bacterium]
MNTTTKLLSILAGAALVNFTAAADTIRQWDFNSVDFDVPGNGTLRPNDQLGYPAQAVGGVGQQFGQVAASTGSSDPNTLDNTHWRLGAVSGVANTGFPAAGNANKTTGAQFHVNTSGYQNIRIVWDQENSATASRYWRWQYTLNGTDWLDSDSVTTASSLDGNGVDSGTPAWVMGLNADLSGITGANDNPNFGIRLVSEFESTATGSGNDVYVANRTTSTYGVNGTLWLDMVTVTGDDLDPMNQRPFVSAIEDQSILNGQVAGPLTFDVYDAETAVNDLEVTVQSSNPTLFSALEVGGTGGQRSITATPAASQTGSAVITIRVKDGGNKITESCFTLAVSANPALSRIFPQITTSNLAAVVAFTVFDLPGDPNTWQFTGTSSDQNVVANSDLVFAGTDSTRTVTVAPQPNVLGDATITVTAASGGFQASTNFLVRFAPDFLVEWDLNVVASNAAVVTLPATRVAEDLTVSELGRGPGIQPSGLWYGFAANRWNNPNSAYNPSTPSRAAALDRGDYFEFSVSIAEGSALSLYSLDASLRRSAVNAAMNFEWQYSLDGFATPGITILPRGLIWSELGISTSTFQYQGRTSGTARESVQPYEWMLGDVPGRPDTTTTPGDAIPTIDLTLIEALQDLNGPATVTFRLYGWGNTSTADSNSASLGRINGPRLRGTVGTAVTSPALTITREGANVKITWPVSATGFGLKSTTGLAPAAWTDVGVTPSVENGLNVVTLPATGVQFFRLEK